MCVRFQDRLAVLETCFSSLPNRSCIILSITLVFLLLTGESPPFLSLSLFLSHTFITHSRFNLANGPSWPRLFCSWALQISWFAFGRRLMSPRWSGRCRHETGSHLIFFKCMLGPFKKSFSSQVDLSSSWQQHKHGQSRTIFCLKKSESGKKPQSQRAVDKMPIIVKNSTKAEKTFCFLCQVPCQEICSHCKLVHFCSHEHFELHHVYLDPVSAVDTF